MRVIERYASAIGSSNLKVDERTVYSDTDVLAGMGLADKALTSGQGFNGPIKPAPLAVALQRLFMGDNRAVRQIVPLLAIMAWEEAKRQKVNLKRVQSMDMARACLAWHRDGVCKACGGHGKLKIPGTTTIGVVDCKPCKGVGKVPFDRQFHAEQREVARWLIVEMERNQAMAGPEAMKWIAPRLDV